jgi:hypothetical protein
VFPSFIQTREEMVVNGILPIDQLREHVSPMRLVCQRIPRSTLISTYGVKLPVPVSASLASPPTQLRQPTVSELLDAFCIMRGFMASTHAGADHPRAARTILKDYCEGKLVYCHPPPTGWTKSAAVPSLSTVPSTNTSSATSSYSRVTLDDNVLLPSQQKVQQQQQNRGNLSSISSLPTVSPIRITSTTKSTTTTTRGEDASTSSSSSSAFPDKFPDTAAVDTSATVVSNAKKPSLPELTEADLLAFSRKVSVSSLGNDKNKNKRQEAYELYEYESEDEEEEEEEEEEEKFVGSNAAATSSSSSSSSSSAAVGNGPSSSLPVNSNIPLPSSSSTTASTTTASALSSSTSNSKKAARQPHVSGLGKFGQKKKGSREPDPYGTERIADAAMRKNVQEEIRLVQQGPAGVGVVLSGDADNSTPTLRQGSASVSTSSFPAAGVSTRAAKSLGPSAASPPSAPQTKQVRVIRAGAIVQDPVPASLRGQNIAPTLVGISASALLKSSKIRIATTD